MMNGRNRRAPSNALLLAMCLLLSTGCGTSSTAADDSFIPAFERNGGFTDQNGETFEFHGDPQGVVSGALTGKRFTVNGDLLPFAGQFSGRNVDFQEANQGLSYRGRFADLDSLDVDRSDGVHLTLRRQ